MRFPALRFVTVVLAALTLTMTSAHVLELPQKMTFGAELYTAVNSNLYRYFAVVGGAYQVGGIVAALLLAFRLRHDGPAFRWTAAGAGLVVLAFASWLALVAPVNEEVSAAWSQAPASVPGLWMRLRDRWEYGHATGFVLQLAGFCALIVSLLVDQVSTGSPRSAAASASSSAAASG